MKGAGGSHESFSLADPGQEPTISRVGDVITIFPTRGSLKTALAMLRGLPKPPEVEIREPIDVPERGD